MQEIAEIPKIANRNSDFLTLQKSEFQKQNPTGIFRIVNGIGILSPMGVPEIRTKNWNSQPSLETQLVLTSWACQPWTLPFTPASKDANILPPLAPAILGTQLGCFAGTKTGDDTILSSLTTRNSVLIQ